MPKAKAKPEGRVRKIFMNPDFKVPVDVDPTEDTEWNDILRSHGIIPERPPSPTAQLEEALDEALKKLHDNRLENKDLDELAELEDDEDEEFLNSYKQKRLDELKVLQEKSKFGSVMPISKNEYEQEITKASEQAPVVVHLSSNVLQSRLLGMLFTQLAAKFPEIKFVDIPAGRAIENYPDSNVPTILVYRNKNVLRQYITLMELGGDNTTVADVEKVLVALGLVEDLDRRLVINQDEEVDDDGRRVKYIKKAIKDDSDDDFFD